MLDGFDERLARLGVDVEAAKARAVSASEFQRRVGEVRGRGSCEGVEVTVDSSGVLVDVDLGRDLAWVRDALLGAYGQARQDAGRAVVGLARDAFGEGDSSVERLRATYGLDGDGDDVSQEPVRGLGVLRPGGWA